MPKFTADVGATKEEKVDYAIIRDGKPILLFEGKKAGTNRSASHSVCLNIVNLTASLAIGCLKKIICVSESEKNNPL